MTDRLLIKGAYVLTQDPELGELAGADVLVEGDKIAAVGHGLSAEGAQVIDATGDIVIPGFIDTHRHTWETSIRTCAPDFALITYFGSILDKFAPHYRPDDVYAGNLWGSLECINAGITTLVDWSHIMNTPGARRRRRSAASRTRGIRSVFAYGFPQHVARGLVVRPRLHGQRPDLGRRRGAPHPEAVLQLGRRAASPWRSRPGARTSASPTSSATTGSWPRSSASTSPSTWRWTGSATRSCRSTALRDMDLLYPNTTYVHASHFTDEEWTLVRDSGGNVSFAPQIEVQMGHGWAPGGDRPRARRADRPLVRRRDDRVVRPVHPDALDLRLGARPQAPGGVGRGPRRAGGLARPDHVAPGPLAGRRSAGPRSPGSPTGPGR